MLCRVEMPTNEQIFARFYRWRLLHQTGGTTRFMLLILPVLLALVAGYSFLVLGTLIPAVLLLLSLAYTIYTLYVRPGQEFRKKAGAAMETEVYIFTENGFTRNVKNEESGAHDHSSSQYDVLVRAIETKQDFYLFYGPTRAYLVDKEYFTKGTPEELRASLRAKMGKHFESKQK